MTVVENRIGAVRGQVLTILRTARRQNGGENLRRGVVNEMAVGVGAHHLHAVAKPFIELSREPVIRRGRPRLIRRNVVLVESRRIICRNDTALVFQSIQVERCRIQCRLTRSRRIRRQEIGWRYHWLRIQENLSGQVDRLRQFLIHGSEGCCRGPLSGDSWESSEAAWTRGNAAACKKRRRTNVVADRRAVDRSR